MSMSQTFDMDMECSSLTEENPSGFSNGSSLNDQGAVSSNDMECSSLIEDNPSALCSDYQDLALSEEEIAERMRSIIDSMSKMFTTYFKPNEIAKTVFDSENSELFIILKDSHCNHEGGMQSFLERLCEEDHSVLKFYRLITTVDDDTGQIPMNFLSGKGALIQSKITSLMTFLKQLVEEENISELTTQGTNHIIGAMKESGSLKKSLKNREDQEPIDRIFSMIKAVYKSKPDWPFEMLDIFYKKIPNFFSKSAEIEQTQGCQDSLSNQIPELGLRVRGEGLCVKQEDIQSEGLNMLLNSCALRLEQLVLEVPKINKSSVEPWNLQECDFSDDENEEDTERKVVAMSGSDVDVDLKLRMYQQELAEVALQGRNTIICAPTGCGKTRVALEIIVKHLKGGLAAPQKPRKVCFFARTVPLAVQQFKAISQYLPKEYKANIFTGESEFNVSLHHLLYKLQFVVLTPMILQNHIYKKNIEDLCVFSLLIFDECHHARAGEPYNTLMSTYIDMKLKTGSQLPQVVGLTASFPVGAAANSADAVRSIIELCANMDASTISVVERSKEELDKFVVVPTEKFCSLQERDEDPSFKMINTVMETLEKEAQDNAKEIGDQTIMGLLEKLPPERKLQRYQNRVVDIHQEAVKLPRSNKETQMPVRLLIIIAKYLKIYHFALETHDLVHLQDVIDYLDDCFAENAEDEKMTIGETRFYDYFKDLKEKMQNYYHDVNTNLLHLMNVLKEFLIQKGKLSRGIVFVRTRAIAEALVSWLNRCNDEEIRNLKASVFTGTNAKESEGGMTQSQQTAMVEKFKNGKVKLLVATSVAEEGIDVPECNLVIKYNHVGNEITTIQTRGRSRKAGGYSILLAMPNIIDKEFINLKRTKLMLEGIKILKKMDEEEFKKNVLDLQIEASKKREIDAMIDAEKKRQWKDKKFKLYCLHCRKFCIESKDIKIVCRNFRIIVNKDVWNEKAIHPSKQKYIDETKMVGSVRCMSEVEDGMKCNRTLGSLVFYNRVYFLAIAIKNFILEEEGRPEPVTAKKWKDIPYPIEDLTTEDIKNYLQSGHHIFSPIEGTRPPHTFHIPTSTLAGVQETMPAAARHLPSFDEASGSNMDCSSSILSQETNEIIQRYPRPETSEGVNINSALSTFTTNSLHHQTDRKEFL